MSILFLYLSDLQLSYFNITSWSSVNNGLGRSCKNFADNLAIGRGKGNSSLFLFIDLSSFSIISLKVITSGPIHYNTKLLSRLSIVANITSTKSET